MRNKIPVWKLKQNIAGLRIDKLNETYISSLFDDISKLHRNDHFVSLLLKSGQAELLVDVNTVQVNARQLVFLFPGQVQRALRFSEKIEGWILFLDIKLVDDHARLMIENTLFKKPVLTVTGSDLKWFCQYFDLLMLTYEDDTLGVLHKSAVNAFASPYIYKIASAFGSTAESVSQNHSGRSVEVTKRFKALVRKHYRDFKKPGDYAALMDFSLSYMSDTVKSVTGFPATYFIQQEIIREGQRLLRYTDLSVKEVSTQLGYDDANYFNRIFARLTGDPPGRFRHKFKTLESHLVTN